MHCIVTAGPTYEPLDQVRRLTNFSTGQLGCELAEFLTDLGHEVTLLIGEQSTWCGERRAGQVEVFTTTSDLRARLAARAVAGAGAVFQAAAVSDFTFSKLWRRQSDGQWQEVRSGKFSTRDGTLLAELAPTPKIIAELRDLFPAAKLVGWKFEVEGGRSDVIAQAKKQLVDSRTDACVANGPAYGQGFGLLRRNGIIEHYEGKPALFKGLEMLLKS